MLGLAAIAALFVTANWIPTVQATADGPDFYSVTDVAADDVLNLRTGASEDAIKIGQIAHDAHGLQNLGCQGLPSYDKWERMTGKEREASRNHYWCKVRYQGVEGWVEGRFLREDSGAPATVTAGPALSGFKMTCRETGAYQVGVSDDGDIQQEDTAIREILSLTIDVKLQGVRTPSVSSPSMSRSANYGVRWTGPWKSGLLSMPTRATGGWTSRKTCSGGWRPSPVARHASRSLRASDYKPGCSVSAAIYLKGNSGMC
jgi:hypothetical protein